MVLSHFRVYGRYFYICEYFVYLSLLALMFPVVFNVFGLGIQIPPEIGSIIFAALTISSLKFKARVSITTTLVLAYLVWSVCTIGLFFLPGNPSKVSAYIVGIYVGVLPVLAYFLGMQVHPERLRNLIKNIVNIHFLVVIFSLLIHLMRPDFYSAYLQEMLKQLDYTDLTQFYARLQGPLGSTAVGVLCMSSIALLPLTGLSAVRRLIYLVTFFVCVLLTFQRSAILMSIMGVVLNTAYFSRGFRIAVILMFAALGFYIIQAFGGADIVVRIISRLAEIREILALEGRPTYAIVFSNLIQYLVGLGVGATTSIADSMGYNPGGQLVDANHMRILGDLGFIGLLLYFSVLVRPLLTGISRPEMIPLAFVLVAYNLQALGTNVLDSYYTGYLYWLYLGLLSRVSSAESSTAAVQV